MCAGVYREDDVCQMTESTGVHFLQEEQHVDKLLWSDAHGRRVGANARMAERLPEESLQSVNQA